MSVKFDRKKMMQYLGKPYKHLGRGPDAFDCWGLPIQVYKDHGIKIFDLNNYDEDWADKGQNLFIENYYQDWKSVVVPRTGDIVLLKHRHEIVDHAGLYYDFGRILQATKLGVVLTRVHPFRPKIFGYYRHVEAL